MCKGKGRGSSGTGLTQKKKTEEEEGGIVQNWQLAMTELSVENHPEDDIQIDG